MSKYMEINITWLGVACSDERPSQFNKCFAPSDIRINCTKYSHEEGRQTSMIVLFSLQIGGNGRYECEIVV